MLNEIMQLDRQYYMPVFGERFPVCFTHGKGVHLYDTEGKEYTDFLAGIAVNALGYSDEGFLRTIHEQVDKVLHTCNYFYNEPQAKAASALCRATNMGKCFFANSGAEAVEGALKLARKYFYAQGKKKFEVITMKGSFHGRTFATLSATGQEKFQTPFQPLMPSFVSVDYNDIDAVAAAITPDTCAVLLEPILGESGVVPAKEGYLKALRALCDQQGLLLIMDEIQTGMGHTGAVLCSAKHGVQPDIVVLAKALGNGVPVGAFLAKDEVASAFTPGDHGSTFGGNPLACNAALYVTQKLTQTDLLDHVVQMGEYMKEQLTIFAAAHPETATETRGEGLMLALELKESAITAKAAAKALLTKGFVVGTAGRNSLRFLPPYIIEREQIDALLNAMNEVL